MTRDSDINRKIIARIETLSPLPEALRVLVDAVANGGLTTERTRELKGQLAISDDDVLAVARSVHEGHDEFDDIDDVFASLGGAGVQRMLAAIALTRALRDTIPDQHLANEIWSHALAVGAMATHVAPNASADPSASWMLGILHEVGRMVTARVVPERAAAIERDVASGVPLHEADREHLGCSAARLAGKTAFVLGLSPALCALLTALENPGLTTVPEVEAVAAADALAPLLGYPPIPGALAGPLDPNLERAMGLDADSFSELAEEASRSVRMASPHGPTTSLQVSEPSSSFDALLEANRRFARLNADYARTRRDLEDRVRETKSLVATFASLTMGLDGDALRYSILESLLEHYEAHTTFLVTSDGDGRSLKGVAFSMIGGPAVLPVRVDLSKFDRETRESLIQGTAVTIRNGPAARQLRSELDDSALFCLAPIMARGSWAGILGLAVGQGQERAATKGEFLNILATAAALGLENARLYGEVLRQATIDPLTRVAARRVVVDELAEVAGLDASARSPFGVLLVDLDNFKAVNDTLGHQAGDQYLRDMADGMAEPLRAADTLGRYGGDEFLLLLRDVTLDETLVIAERVRQAAETVAAAEPWTEITETLGASIGVSWWDGGPIEAATLLAMADSSLYIGKSEGRNAVGMAAVRERF